MGDEVFWILQRIISNRGYINSHSSSFLLLFHYSCSNCSPSCSPLPRPHPQSVRTLLSVGPLYLLLDCTLPLPARVPSSPPLQSLAVCSSQVAVLSWVCLFSLIISHTQFKSLCLKRECYFCFPDFDRWSGLSQGGICNNSCTVCLCLVIKCAHLRVTLF